MDNKSWADGWIVEGDFMKSLLQDIGAGVKTKFEKNEKAKVLYARLGRNLPN